MRSYRRRSKLGYKALCYADPSFHRISRSAFLYDCGACGQANSDKRLGSHSVRRQRGRGARSGRICDEQSAGYRVYQFRGRIPKSNVCRVIQAGSAIATDQRLTMLQGKTISITGTVELYKGKPEINVVSADQIKVLDSPLAQ